MIRVARFFEMAMTSHYLLVILSARASLRDRLVTTFFPHTEHSATGLARHVVAPLTLYTTNSLVDVARQQGPRPRDC